jgi:hypothetical protein
MYNFVSKHELVVLHMHKGFPALDSNRTGKIIFFSVSINV